MGFKHWLKAVIKGPFFCFSLWTNLILCECMLVTDGQVALCVVAPVSVCDIIQALL